MAMIFVYDHSVKERRRSYAIWALPCSRNLTLEQVSARVKRLVRNCYSGLSFSDSDGKLLRASVVAGAVVDFAVEQRRPFWEYQIHTGYVAVVPFDASMSGLTVGLQDIEKIVLKANGWTLH